MIGIILVAVAAVLAACGAPLALAGLLCIAGIVCSVVMGKKQLTSTADEASEAARKEWDYIIVGGGTAGCVLANRLTADTGKRVLVLEAGGSDYNDKRIRIPTGVLHLFQHPQYDWNFTTTSEKKTDGRGIYLCRGKVLGGSSCVNVLLYGRGNAHDYDLWGSDFGLTDWVSSKVLPYFKRTQADCSGLAQKDPKHHSKDGEWCTDHVRYQNELSKTFLTACEQIGVPSSEDFNNWDKNQAGAGRFHVSECNGTRCSAASALLAPALADSSRKLTVLCGAGAEKVQFDNGSKATGVNFNCGGATHHAALSKGGEVILALGAIQSPQLLMVSGVGPKAQLAEHNITTISDRAGVGENLQDHPAANVSYQCPSSKKGISPTSKAFFVMGKKLPHPMFLLDWLINKSGPLTSPGCDHGGFFRTAEATQKENSPDLQMRFLAVRAVTADGMNSVAKFRDVQNHPDGFSFQNIAVRSNSVGRVRLSSSSMSDYPVVEGNYLSDKRDLASLREGLKLSRKLAQQDSFKDYIGHEVFPGPEVKTDAQLDEYISQSVHSSNALVGTCRMGRSDDPMAVCDSEMRVLGVHNLRVCDASVMPKVPGCQTSAPTVMIAERAADMILKNAAK